MSDASEVLKSRIRVPTSSAPPNITVKSVEDNPDEVLIVGSPWEAGSMVEDAITGEVGYYYARRGRFGLYTVVDARSLGGCRLELPGGVEAELVGEECPAEGELVRVTIVRDSLSPGEPVKARLGASLVGDYVIVSAPGSGVSFSEHIRSGDLKAELTVRAIEAVDTSRVHVRFRSSSRSSDPEKVIEEARKLAGEVLELASSPPSGVGVVRRGEYISILGLPQPAKARLDEVRSEVVPTVYMHHSIKAGGQQESMLVDYTEEAMRSGSCSGSAGADMLYYIASRLAQRGKVYIRHIIPGERSASIGPFRVESVSRREGCIRVKMARTFRSPGVYDGLGVEKRPGDQGVTEIDTCSWVTMHTYMDSRGKVIGYYANVNTPPEVSLSGIRYMDLYIDVVMRPGEEPSVIDREELDRAYSSGLLSEKLYNAALEWAEKAARILSGLS